MHGKILLAIKKINALSLRERILLFITLLGAVYFLWEILIFDQLLGSKEKINYNIQAMQEQVAKLHVQMASVSKTIRTDPYKDLKEKIKTLKKENKKFEDDISHLTAQLIPPKEMTELLHKILSEDDELTLIRVENLAEKPMFTDKQEVDEETIQRLQIYKHGLEIEFISDYFTTKRFLEKLEALPWELLWDELHYEVKEYPKAVVRVVIYTLSLQKAWIEA